MPSKQTPNKKELLSAIRQKCLDCSGGMRSEVKNCRIRDCPLWPYRSNALEDELQQQIRMEGMEYVS